MSEESYQTKYYEAWKNIDCKRLFTSSKQLYVRYVSVWPYRAVFIVVVYQNDTATYKYFESGSVKKRLLGL